ncbi:hypothetical protein [Nitrosopumilus adriaticus]|uniref:hypothetical protein n=1 Tax=Nitrosopumilus adriaticus TaxID=1580092 RepID=UPI00352F2569
MVTKISEKSEQIDCELSWHEEIIKAHLGEWIEDVNKKAELESKLKQAFENSKSHTEHLSQL